VTLILALTADEEGGRGPNGVDWLLKNRRAFIDAEFCVNTDAGGGQAQNGHRQLYSVQAAEKGYASFLLTARNPGGHSSLPRRENAIYELAAALLKIRDVQFPVHLNEVTRGYFLRTAALTSGQDAADRRAVAQDPPDLQAAPGFPGILTKTLCCIPPVSPPCCPAATPTMLCLRRLRPRSTAGCCRGKQNRKWKRGLRKRPARPSRSE